MFRMLERIWKEKKVPEVWKEGFLVKVPKKATEVNVTTIEELCSFQSQGNFLMK